MSARMALVTAVVFILSSCGAPGGGADGGLGALDTADCIAAKEHLCQNIAGQNCSTSTMGNAMAKVTAACTAASATTLNCAALPQFTTVTDVSCAKPEVFSYSGTATADGRTAQLSLTITGTRVSGTLHADPVCTTGTHLTRTDFTFTGTLSGRWEGEGSAIAGTWNGGDYDCAAVLMSGYPTSGSVTISLAGIKVSLQRVVGGWQYRFATTGRTIVPTCADGG